METQYCRDLRIAVETPPGTITSCSGDTIYYWIPEELPEGEE